MLRGSLQFEPAQRKLESNLFLHGPMGSWAAICPVSIGENDPGPLSKANTIKGRLKSCLKTYLFLSRCRKPEHASRWVRRVSNKLLQQLELELNNYESMSRLSPGKFGDPRIVSIVASKWNAQLPWSVVWKWMGLRTHWNHLATALLDHVLLHTLRCPSNHKIAAARDPLSLASILLHAKPFGLVLLLSLGLWVLDRLQEFWLQEFWTLL